MRDWPCISDNALTMYCGVLFVENHTCMHVDETTEKCRSLTQSYKWGFFSLTQILTLVYLCHSEDLWLQCCMSLFSVMHPLLFLSLSTTPLDSNVLHVAYDRIILCVPHLHHFTSHTWTYEGISFKRNSARCRVDILLYLHVSSICLYPLIFFCLLLKATKYSSYYILHKASSHQFDQ